MKKILLLFLLCLILPNIIFSKNIVTLQEFNILRKNHSGLIAAKSFIAQMSPNSAKKLLKNKIKGQYFVEVIYNNKKGVQFLVKNTEPFYENILSSYATYINMMLLPLLSNEGYMRLQKRFIIALYDKNVYKVEYKKGDVLISYFFKVGEYKLIDQIAYYENNKKIFILGINWEKIENLYIPLSVKTISYEKNRIAGSFSLEKVKIIK